MPIQEKKKKKKQEKKEKERPEVQEPYTDVQASLSFLKHPTAFVVSFLENDQNCPPPLFFVLKSI
jgi:hypothetical protein